MPLCIHRFPGVDGVFEFTHDAGKARKDKMFFFEDYAWTVII